MILGIGVDAVCISRMEKLGDATLKRIFSTEELEEYENLHAVAEIKNQYLASRFAVKEAYAKARGLGFGSKISPQEITTKKDENGKPFIVLKGKTLENAPKCNVQLSITHEDPLAIAFVVLEGFDGQN